MIPAAQYRRKADDLVAMADACLSYPDMLELDALSREWRTLAGLADWQDAMWIALAAPETGHSVSSRSIGEVATARSNHGGSPGSVGSKDLVDLPTDHFEWLLQYLEHLGHPSSEALTAYAKGTSLAPSAVTAHCAQCGDCRAAITAIETREGSVLSDTSPSQMSPNALEIALAKIEEFERSRRRA